MCSGGCWRGAEAEVVDMNECYSSIAGVLLRIDTWQYWALLCKNVNRAEERKEERKNQYGRGNTVIDNVRHNGINFLPLLGRSDHAKFTALQKKRGGQGDEKHSF